MYFRARSLTLVRIPDPKEKMSLWSATTIHHLSPAIPMRIRGQMLRER